MRSTVLPGATALHTRQNKINQYTFSLNAVIRVRSGIMSIVLFPAIILLHIMHPISST